MRALDVVRFPAEEDRLPGYAVLLQSLTTGIAPTIASSSRNSNITRVFGAPASGHFGTQPINGAVRVRE
jgi:hypothetical protein